MDDQPNQRWWRALPPVETRVPCGGATHPVRWEAGRLVLPAHPDTEGELVLAALGGTKAGCVEVAEMWGRHADDLSVLATGPRCATDRIVVSWDDVEAFRSQQQTGWFSYAPFAGRTQPSGPTGSSGPPPTAVTPPGPGPGGGGRGVPHRHGGGSSPRGGRAGSGVFPGSGVPPRLASARRQMLDRLERFRSQRIDMLSLFALGAAFHLRLTGTVAASWSNGGSRARDRAAHRPALAAALTGRLAPAVAEWLGIDPDAVQAWLHEGPGWGTVELHGDDRTRLRASLPVGWLALVWACGMAVVDGHLVVAVERAAWPDARVLALPKPNAAPVLLDIHASVDASAASPRWRVTDAGPPATDGATAG